MTTDIKLLPLPEGESSSFGNYEVHTNETMTDYARACVEANTEALRAEIEALRSRLECLVRNDLNEQCRAWRLAEALREATDLLLSDYPEEAKRLRAALHSHRVENIKDKE